MVQHGISLNFNRNEWEEEEVWRAQCEVGSQIQAALDHAFQLHKTTDYEISKVNASLRDLFILGRVVFLPLTPSTRSG